MLMIFVGCRLYKDYRDSTEVNAVRGIWFDSRR